VQGNLKALCGNLCCIREIGRSEVPCGNLTIPLGIRPPRRIGLMALLDESNLLAERARHAKFRTNHVGTKLNEAELHELGELVAKRKETPAELIRGLILRELKRDKEGLKPSAELIEITAIRLQIVNLLKPVLTGIKLTPEVFDGVIKEVKNRKRGLALEILEEHEKA
jgi:hypothetical protein